MYGLNPFAQPDIDPIELQKIRGLLGASLAAPPMAQQQPQMAMQQPPEPPPQMTPQGGQQIMPDFPVARSPMPDQPQQPPMQVPMPPRRPESFGPEGGMPSLVGQAMPNMGPETATPEQRQMTASSAGKPQDARPNDPISGFDAGLDKMMTDPLFHIGINLLANPRNIGQGLASGLQGWTSASRQAKMDKRAEEAAKRRNIHWQVINGQLTGVDLDNPNAPVIVPGGQPQKQMFKTIEQDGVKYQQDPETGRLFPLQGAERQDKYEPVLDENGNPIAQRNLKTGRVEADPRAKSSSPEAKYSERQAQGQAMGLEGEELRQFTLTGKYKPGGGAVPEKMTEAQAKSAEFASRMDAADRIISDPNLSKEALGWRGAARAAASEIPYIGGFLVSKEYRKLAQAERDWINAKLRPESGATITPAEFENAKKQYLPMPEDDEDTLKQKAANRKRAMEGTAFGASPSFKEQFFGTPTPNIVQHSMDRQQGGATGSVQSAPKIDRDAAIAEARRRGLIK